jgi:hypothetical protein
MSDHEAVIFLVSAAVSFVVTRLLLNWQRKA